MNNNGNTKPFPLPQLHYINQKTLILQIKKWNLKQLHISIIISTFASHQIYIQDYGLTTNLSLFHLLQFLYVI